MWSLNILSLWSNVFIIKTLFCLYIKCAKAQFNSIVLIHSWTAVQQTRVSVPAKEVNYFKANIDLTKMVSIKIFYREMQPLCQDTKIHKMLVFSLWLEILNVNVTV